jgi:AraC-like DNA-binding protein
LAIDFEAEKQLADEVRQRLRFSLAHHQCPTARHCADELGISMRSMQQRLKTIGLTFSILVDEVRFDLAREKLLHSNDTIDEISESLGYSSQENFIRAFYRWSSISPAEFRRQGRM